MILEGFIRVLDFGEKGFGFVGENASYDGADFFSSK